MIKQIKATKDIYIHYPFIKQSLTMHIRYKNNRLATNDNENNFRTVTATA